MPNTTPTSTEAREAVNIFASIDVLGLLNDKDYPGLGGSSIEDAIKKHFEQYIPQDERAYLMSRPLQKWNSKKEKYVFNGMWNEYISEANGNYKKFASTSGTTELLGKYVRLIANRGDTQGWKLKIDGSDLTKGSPQYLTEAFNLSVKAKPGQWLRWWGNSITPFSELQCVISSITNRGRPQPLTQLDHQQDISVVYNFPSGVIDNSTYNTASSVAFSHMGQLNSNVAVNSKIQYDILFKLVDSDGDVIASFQVDPEIIVI